MMRLFAGKKLVPVLSTVAVLCAGPSLAPASAAAPVWHVSRSPKLRVDMAKACPASVTKYQDVVNTYPGPPLVPAGPRAALVCRYGPTTVPGHARLFRQSRLDRAQAGRLATAVRRLNLTPPTGVMSCPFDSGLVVVIGFSYPGRPAVGLWYHASGCQTLDNGRIGAFMGGAGDPGLWNAFVTTLDRFSAPPSRELTR